MQTITEEIERLKANSIQIAESFRIYNDKLLFTGFSGTEPFLAEEILEIINYVTNDTKLAESVHKFDRTHPDFNLLFRIYCDVNLRFRKLERGMTVFETHPVDMTRIGSHTSSGTSLTINFIRDTVIYFGELRNVFERFKVDIESIELLQIITDEISPIFPAITVEQIQNINDIYMRYVGSGDGNLVIDLYVILLHKIILMNTGTPDGKDKIKFVNKSVERLKSDILKTPEVDKIKSTNKNSNTVQRLIQRNNLVPLSLSVPLPELISMIGGSIGQPGPEPESCVNLLKQLAKTMSGTRRIGFILIIKIAPRPLEYNFWTLVDERYIQAKQLGQSGVLGVNPVSLERFTTIFPIEANPEFKDDIVMINDEFAEDVNTNYYYVIETISGNKFRLLISWSLFEAGGYAIPASWLNNIDNKEYSPSRRLECYNVISDRALAGYLQKPLISYTSANRGEITRDPTYWSVFRNRVKHLILQDIGDAISERFIEVGKREQLTYDKLEETILNKRIYKKALVHITNTIKTDTITSMQIRPEVQEQFQIELVMSYFADLNTIERYLYKDTDNMLRRDYRDKLSNIVRNFIKEKKVYQIKNKALDIMDVILTEILERFINQRSGIYLSIQKKLELINASLLKA